MNLNTNIDVHRRRTDVVPFAATMYRYRGCFLLTASLRGPGTKKTVFCLGPKKQIETLYGAVEKLAPFVVYQSRCWTRAGGSNVDPLLPAPTICGKCAPLFEICRKVVTLECFIERTTPGRLRAAYRLSMLNPAS